MEADYTQALYHRQAYQLTQQEIAIHSAMPTREKQLRWPDMKQKEAWQQMENTNSDAQIPLRFRIATLQASLQEAQALIAPLTTEPTSKEI